MARTDNLNNYLTDVATAIKTKKGDSTPINASNFDTEIANLPGGNIEVPYHYLDMEDVSDTSNTWQQAVCPITFTYWSGLESSKYCDISDFSFVEQFDLSNFKSTYSMFNNCREMVTAPKINTSNVKNVSYMFNKCYKLENIPNYDFSNVRYAGQTFYNCTALENIPQFNFGKLSSFSYMFGYCPNLTDTSLNNLMASILTANNSNISSSKRTLGSFGLSTAQINRCHNLSNYQAVIDKGWKDGSGLD